MGGVLIKTGKRITKTAQKITVTATNGDLKLNAAKSIKYSAQKDLVYDSYVAPESKRSEILQVTKMVCSNCGDDNTVEIGKIYTFKAVQFSRKPKAGGKELENVKWAYQIDDGDIIDFPNPKGTVIGNSVVKKVRIAEDNYDNKEVTIYAYTEKVIENVNVKCEIKIVRIELLLLFYVDELDQGTKMFREAAQTRLKNIKNSDWYDSSIHKVHCPPIQTIDEIIEIIPKYYKKYGGKERVLIREMGFFSHSGKDGPICYDTKITICPYNEKGMQMKMCGWEKIDLVWVEQDAICVFYGCNSSAEWFTKQSPYKNFAENISKLNNFKNVEVWGQSTSSFPSFLPDYRATSIARSTPGVGSIGWDVGPTYMVAGNSGEILESLHLGSQREFKKKEVLNKLLKGNNMNCYKNGKKIRSIHQGYFNDHRKTTVTGN